MDEFLHNKEVIKLQENKTNRLIQLSLTYIYVQEKYLVPPTIVGIISYNTGDSKLRKRLQEFPYVEEWQVEIQVEGAFSPAEMHIFGHLYPLTNLWFTLKEYKYRIVQGFQKVTYCEYLRCEEVVAFINK